MRSNRNHKELEKKLNFHYQLVNGRRAKNNLYWECVYCGEPATERDHVPPLTRFYDYEALGFKRNFYMLVPCCGRCNSLLSNSLQDDILKRVEHLKNLLAKKNKKRLKAPEWDFEECRDLGPNLRSYVTTEDRKAQKIRNAIEYYHGYEALQDWLFEELDQAV